jgi:hypothetical protein
VPRHSHREQTIEKPECCHGSNNNCRGYAGVDLPRVSQLFPRANEFAGVLSTASDGSRMTSPFYEWQSLYLWSTALAPLPTR